MVSISQGEKQLLTITRAILTETKILILDEATSSGNMRRSYHSKGIGTPYAWALLFHHSAPPVHYA
jgi:predicted ABC-type transport system involved in lysophospholipase L1 biosynthesis ATPase subunit